MLNLLPEIVICVWDSCFDNAKHIESQLLKFNPIIIDSTSNSNFNSEHKSRNIFIEQLNKALILSNPSKYVIYISGDAVMENWDELIDRTNDVFNKEKPFVYSPYITFEGYPSEKVKLQAQLADEKLELGVMTDGIVFALSKETCEFIRMFTNYLLAKSTHSYKVGWGLDWSWSIFSILNKKLIVRDKKLRIYHPKSTSYSTDVARSELSLILQELSSFIEQFGFSRIQTNRVIYAISERLKSNPKYLSTEAFYAKEILGLKP